MLSGRSRWTSGFFRLNGRLYQPGDLGRVIGSEIGVQIERPDRPGGVLFDNMTRASTICAPAYPKAGQHIIRKKIVSSILSSFTLVSEGNAAAATEQLVLP